MAGLACAAAALVVFVGLGGGGDEAGRPSASEDAGLHRRSSAQFDEMASTQDVLVELGSPAARVEAATDSVVADASEERLTIRIFDPEGGVVPRADIVLVAGSDELRTRTGSDGAASLAFVPGREWFLLRVAAERYYHHAARYALAPGQRELSVTLQSAGVFRGRVLSARSGKGVPRAEVDLEHSYCLDECSRTVVATDASGDFEMPAVPLGRASHFRVVAQGFPATGFVFDAPFDGIAELVLGAGTIIGGTVRDARDGTPIEDAVVTTQDGVEGPARTDEDGVFRALYVNQARGVRFLIAADGYESLEYRVEAGQDASDLAVQLEPLVHLRGFVSMAGDVPLAGARVTIRSTVRPVGPPPTDASPAGDGSISFQRVDVASYDGEGVTDTEGRFVFPGFPAEMTAARLSVTHEAILSFHEELQWRASPGEHVELRIEARPRPSTSIEGRIRFQGRVSAGIVFLFRGDEALRCDVGADGLYRFEGVAAGEVQLRASIPEVSQVLAGSEFVARLATGDALRHDFDLVPSELELTGSVSDWNGTPVQGRQVSAVSRHGAVVDATRTDASGEFRLLGVSESAPYRILVRGSALLPTSTLAYAGGPPVDIRLPERHTVLLTLKRSDEVPIPPVLVTARVPDLPGTVLYERLEAGVREHRFDLPPGEYYLDVRPEGLAPQSRRVRVGRHTRVDLELDAGLPVELVADGTLVLGTDLFLVPAAQVEEMRAASSFEWSPHAEWFSRSIEQYRVAFETSSGRARLPGLEPGRYEFFHDDSIVVQPRTIEVTPLMRRVIRVSVATNDPSRARVWLSSNQD